MNIQDAQAILAAVGTDSAPTVEKLTEARACFVDAAKSAKAQGAKPELAAMLEAIRVADRALAEAKDLEAQEAKELAALVADIPELADAPVEEPEPVVEVEPTRVLSVAEAVARLGLGDTAPSNTPPVVEVIEPTQTLNIGGEMANDATWSDIGNEFHKAAKSQLRGGRTVLASFRTEYAHQVGGKVGENTRLIEGLSRRSGESAVMAAGGCCSLAEPVRDNLLLASLDRPLADRIPTLGTASNIGRVAFYPSTCLSEDGVGLWTCADDANVDPEDPDTWKSCSDGECEDPVEVTVNAIYKCLTVGNFQSRFAPEQWEEKLHTAASQQARIADQAIFAGIRAASGTPITAVDTGSVYVTFVQSVLRAAAAVRQNQRYLGRTINVFADALIKTAADADVFARAVSKGRVPEADGIETILARHNIAVTWTEDVTGLAAGTLAYPATAEVVLFVDGSVFRLDGGELNLGTEVRDFGLNRQNKVSAFAESFESVVVRGCGSKALTIPVTVCAEAACIIAEEVTPDVTP